LGAQRHVESVELFFCQGLLAALEYPRRPRRFGEEKMKEKFGMFVCGLALAFGGVLLGKEWFASQISGLNRIIENAKRKP
jgi:hypothetical protein